MSDEELTLAVNLTAEEELLQWAAEPEPVPVRLRTRVLAAVRERVRRKQARREMQWAAAGLLSWMLMTHGRSAVTSTEPARITAEAPFQGYQRLPAGADAERSRRGDRDGLLSQAVLAKASVDMQSLDDKVWHGELLRAGLTTRRSLEESPSQTFLEWSFRRGTEST